LSGWSFILWVKEKVEAGVIARQRELGRGRIGSKRGAMEGSDLSDSSIGTRAHTEFGAEGTNEIRNVAKTAIESNFQDGN
jgi:hypothetical protein